MRPPEPHPPVSRARGFSLVEMLVALVFISILMAGMATVFKTSLGNYVASAGAVSSRRQNVLAMDVLVDDLNLTGMTPSSLLQPSPMLSTSNPAFSIIPNVPFANTDVVNPVTDQLILFYDNVVPFPIKIRTPLSSTALDVLNGTSLNNALFATLATPTPIILDFLEDSQAAATDAAFTSATATGPGGAAGPGMTMLLPSGGLQVPLATLRASGTTATVTLAPGTTIQNNIAANATIYLIVPGTYVRYSIRPQQLDPSAPTSYTPCLMRDALTYPRGSAPSWATPISSSIVATDVTAFHVGLSANGGATWAGMTNPVPGTGPAWGTGTAQWPNINNVAADGNTTFFNAQLASLYTGASANTPLWVRTYPALVRVDITTRTVNKRTEYSQTAGTADYSFQTRSLILSPRHFGLFF